MSKLPSITSQKVIRVLEKRGFAWIEQRAAIISITILKQKEEWLFQFIKKICQKERCLKF